MIKTVIFDWNGTLLADTRACHEASTYFILQTMGFDVDAVHSPLHASVAKHNAGHLFFMDLAWNRVTMIIRNNFYEKKGKIYFLKSRARSTLIETCKPRPSGRGQPREIGLGDFKGIRPLEWV